MSARLRSIVPLIFLITSFFCQGQGEAAIWYFGQNAGVDFSSGIPVPLTDGQLNTSEGCSSISNSNAELLFYTDGVTVYDKNHNIMPNGTGLFGDSSSTQSGIIVPKPNDINLYYIFTVTAEANSNGLRYSEVDMSLNGGNGDVTATKNVPLATPCAEKISAVQHANGLDFWVVSHIWGNANFVAYKVTETGVDVNPVTSTIGSVHSGVVSSSIGYMKISPNGEKIALAKWSENSIVEIFDFNSTTGAITNPVLIENIFFPGSINGAYGLEFSPDSNLLYVADTNFSGFTGKVHQFNVSLGNQAAIINSDQIVYEGNDLLSAIQLSIDEKIYLSNSTTTFLDAIENPNEIGAACSYVNRSLNLNGRVTVFGLPPFIQSFFVIGIETENVCLGETNEFSINSTEPVTSILWNFGDGNTSILENPTHIYTAAGTYTVSVVVDSASDSRSLSRDVIVSEVPVANSMANYVLCDDDSNDQTEIFDLLTKDIEILGSQSNTTFNVLYFDNMQDAIDHNNALGFNYTNTSNGQEIFAKIFNSQNRECYDITSFLLIVDVQPIANNVEDLILCDDEVNDQTELVDLTQFDVEVLNGQSDSDFNITYHLSQDDANLGVDDLPDNFQTIDNPQPIFVRIENILNSDCFDTTVFNIVIDGQLIAFQPENMYTCDDESNDGIESFNLSSQDAQISNGQAGPFNITYHISEIDAHTNENSIPTTYTNTENPQQIFVRIENSTNSNCYDTTSFFIEVMEIPVIEMEDIWYICTNETVTIQADPGYDEYLWSTGETTQSIIVNQSGTYSVTVFNNYPTTPTISCSDTKSIQVIESDEAILIDVEIQDWTSNSNYITVFVEGIGDYEYSLDDYLYQDSNVFGNLVPGDYVVYIRDKNGCGTINEDVYLLYYPLYFTPNGDGYHDNWQIHFSDTEPDLEILIFDRYGKLIKQISPTSQGWDGTFNGQPLSTSDYWFVVNRPSKNKQYTGHFTLKH